MPSLTIPLTGFDCDAIAKSEERASLLQAALHEPFQLQSTALGAIELRRYLDVILHGLVSDIEEFLTEKDWGRANGAISNMLRITCAKDISEMRRGR